MKLVQHTDTEWTNILMPWEYYALFRYILRRTFVCVKDWRTLAKTYRYNIGNGKQICLAILSDIRHSWKSFIFFFGPFYTIFNSQFAKPIHWAWMAYKWKTISPKQSVWCVFIRRRLYDSINELRKIEERRKKNESSPSKMRILFWYCVNVEVSLPHSTWS